MGKLWTGVQTKLCSTESWEERREWERKKGAELLWFQYGLLYRNLGLQDGTVKGLVH
jgi:hypothetical protein